MKKASLLGFMSLFLFVSCNVKQEVGENDGDTITPGVCGTKSAVTCDMPWRFTLTTSSMPQNLQIFVNNKKVYDECAGDPIDRSTGGKIIMTVNNFLRVTKIIPFKLNVKKADTCYATATDYFLRDDQAYMIGRDEGGQDLVIVNINN